MTDVRDAVASFRQDRPDADDVLRTVLAVDADSDAWTFNDVDVGTGVFGELVSRGIVEQKGDGYRLADRAAVEAVVADNSTKAPHTNATDDRSLLETLSHPPISNQTLAGAVLALCLVIAVRLTSILTVYQQDYVVLLANDPYFYRYWLFDFVNATRSPLTVAEGIKIGEPLLVATLQLTTAVLGGTPGVADHVLAWYPIVAAVGSAIAVYAVAQRLTGDRRVAIASVVLLAVIPIHGYRSALGFADHHAFDYLILGITFASVVAFERAEITAAGDLLTRRVWPWTLLAAVGIAAHVLAWNAGALLIVPLAVLAAARALTVVKHRTSIATMAPLLFSTALGGTLAYVVHTTLEWQTINMVVPPLLLAGGVALVTVVAAIAHRLKLGPIPTLFGIIASGTILLVGVTSLLPEFGAELTQEVSRQFLNGERDIAETQSLFDTDLGFIAAPFGYFGLSIFFALPVFVWGSWFGWTRNRGDWLTLSAYAWTFFVFSLAQVRFAGHLALPTAASAGVAFVWLAAKVGEFDAPGTGASASAADERRAWKGLDDDTATNADDRDLRSTVTVLIGLFLLLGGLGAVMTPIGTAALSPTDEAVAATDRMDDYATAQNLTWRDNYVFSEWSWNRMHNGLISGESQSYGYARDNFGEFLSSTNNAAWYDRLRNRAGFVVVSELDNFEDAPDDTIYAQLQREWGVDTHYRVLYAGDDGTKAFAIVPGRVVSGPASGGSVAVSGTMAFDNRTRNVSTTIPVENGMYSVRLSTPGTYTIGNRTVTVTENQTLGGS